MYRRMALMGRTQTIEIMSYLVAVLPDRRQGESGNAPLPDSGCPKSIR